MKKCLIFLFLLLYMGIHAQTVRVAAASNLRFIMQDIKAEYLKLYPHAEIEISLGASGALMQQIIHGAPFDFFLSADASFLQKLKNEAFTIGDIRIFGYGKLVLWSNTLDVTKGMAVLSEKRVTRIALAKPEIAPYGEIAVQCLKFYKLYDALKPKFIYADNISQAAQFAETGNAEVAFLAYSLVMGPELRNKGTYFIPDHKSYKPIEQACALLKNSKGNPEALKFMNFVLGDACQPLFERYGYLVQ